MPILCKSIVKLISKSSCSVLQPSFRWKHRVLSIMPNRPMRDQWEYPRKMQLHSPIKQVQPIRMALVSLLAEVSHDVNDGRETSAGFRRVV